MASQPLTGMGLDLVESGQFLGMASSDRESRASFPGRATGT
jgi:hypothetical protein